MHSTRTIVALSSGAPPSGIAVIRASGPDCRLALTMLTGGVPEPRKAMLRTIRATDKGMIDRGIVLFFEGPASVTGEDLAEFHLHGGRAVIAACLDALIAVPGVRLAAAGEFTRRAYENGRIDLTEAEGLADLLSAETEVQRRQAFAQTNGTLRRLYEGWMTQLVQARAMLEASFDFSDEGDVGHDVAWSVREVAVGVGRDIGAHLARARGGEIVRDGFKVAIVGAPNVGKSTLLNALTERDAAITSPLPGTTRDVIEVRLDLGGLPVRLFDTAGLRETDDPVEAIGVERARTMMRAADLVILMEDGTAALDQSAPVEFGPEPSPFEHADAAPAVLRVYNKADQVPEALWHRSPARGSPIWISARTGAGLNELVEQIVQAAKAAAGDPSDAVPSRARHRESLATAAAMLEKASKLELPDEIRAEDLRLATDALGALTGQVGAEKLLDIIFSQFCIGK